jgi:preprotein translocase subunit SecB
MKPISSPLKLLDFAIMRMEFEFIPNPEAVNTEKVFETYELDLDFDVFKNDIMQIVMTVDINTGSTPKPGYKISAEVVSLFKMDTSAVLTEGEKENLEGFSTLYIALNNLRGVISSFTAHAPFGRYILPSIDLNDLIQKKKKTVQEEEEFEEVKKAEEATDPRQKIVKPKKKNMTVK